MNYRFTTRAILAAVGLIAFVGCSERGPHTIPVYGTVKFVGREAPKVCNLYFQPIKVEGLSRPATSQCDPDGAYAVKAFQNSRGLIPGTYGVRVYYYDLKPGANPGLDASWRETKYEAGEVVIGANSSDVEHNIEVPAKI
jgi:hypothetical protein